MSRNLARILISFVTMLVMTDVNLQAAGGGYLYALRNVAGGSNQIFGFQVNELTGALTALPGNPVSTGGNGSGQTVSEQLAYDPANGRLYAINDGSDTISAYSLDLTTGALTALPFSPISLGAGGWNCLAVHPTGSPLVAGDSAGLKLASFNLTSSSATAAAGSPFATGTGDPFSCAFSRDGNYVYTGGNSGTNIAGFGVNVSTGVLTALPGSPFNSGAAFPAAYATDNAGRLFVANALTNQVRVFTTSGGLPSPVLGSPVISGLTTAVHGVLHPAGYYLVGDRDGNRVGVYRIDGSGPSTTLAAVGGSPFAAGGTYTDALALNQSGAFLFAANGNTRNITAFTVNAGTGALTSPVTQAVNTLGATGRITGLAYAGQPQPPSPLGSGFVYTLADISGAENQIYGFRVNELNGALTALSGFPIGTGGNGQTIDTFQLMAYDQARERLYVLNYGSDTVSAYSVDRTTGWLTPLPFSPINLGTGSWYFLALDPDGSTLVSGDLFVGSLVSFHITGDSASPAPGSPYASGAFPAIGTFSRDGAYVYASGNGPNIAGYGVNQATSELTPLSGSPFDSGGIVPLGLAFDDAGRLFVAHHYSNQLRVFTTSDGLLSPVTGNPFPSGLTLARHGVIHPAGYYLVADRTGNRVGVYRIAGNGSDTTLTALSGSPFASGGSLTSILALNRSATLLFAANTGSRNITSYGVNASNGALAGISIQPGGSAGNTGGITGMAYVPGLNYLFLPLLQR